MKEIVEYTDAYKTAWMGYVESSPSATVAHQIAWKEVMHDSLGYKPRYILVTEGPRIRGILPLFIVRTWWQSRYIISLPWIDYGGICADDSETEKLLLSEACRIVETERAEFMELRSVKADNPNLVHRQDKVTFLLRLDKYPEKIWKGFDAKLRNQIRKSQKSGLTAEFGGAEKLLSFYKVFSYNMRDLGTPVWGIDFFQSILKKFPDTSQIILVKKDEKVIASGLVLSFKDRLYVPSASSYRSFLKYCPNHALYWEVIKKGCEQGYEYFDFGRSSWYHNTFNFKKQWVPVPTQLTWQYYLRRRKDLPLLSPSNPKYRFLIGLWKKLPLAIANYLGPKIIKNFP
jgi:FemAB-related protein (PEP-CTERM system-associated)